MTAYISLAAGAVFLTVIVSFIIPKGKLCKSINFVVRVACMLILIVPVTGIFNMSLEDGGQLIVDYDYICDVYSDSQSRTLERMIEENLGIECVCEVEIIYEDGAFKENGVTIFGDFVESDTINKIQSYLTELGYININVNEKIS